MQRIVLVENIFLFTSDLYLSTRRSCMMHNTFRSRFRDTFTSFVQNSPTVCNHYTVVTEDDNFYLTGTTY